MEIELLVVLCNVREDNEDKMELKFIFVLIGVALRVEIGLVKLYIRLC